MKRFISQRMNAITRNKNLVLFNADEEQLKGKGFSYKGNEFIHHSELHHHETAFYNLIPRQKIVLVIITLLLASAFIFNWHLTLILIFSSLTVLYFFDLLFNAYLIYQSFSKNPQITIPQTDIDQLTLQELPVYTIFCPLYKEWQVVPQFVKAMSQLDYPADKLQIVFLLEQNDTETVEKIRAYDLPSSFEIIIVPHSKPKTKPKAMNYGLRHVRGQYLVIYDAEDIPEAGQLKKAVAAFKKTDPSIVCIQAKLNFYNPHQNILTRLFTAEYSLWFDLVLPGLQSVYAPIPLGGTSNHFIVSKLRELQGWDAFNVTEDCDLGMRLAKRGYHTAIIDSTTYEEANSDVKNWYNQRSRWIKGYIQTYFVHMRNPDVFFKQGNLRDFFLFQLIVGGKILSMFINPIMWLITICYFLFRAKTAAFIESLFPGFILDIGVFSLVFGNFLYLYYYMLGCAHRGYDSIIKFAFIIPVYWLGMSFAAWKALYEIVVKPHYWSKTVHGLHLSTPEQKKEAREKAKRESAEEARFELELNLHAKKNNARPLYSNTITTTTTSTTTTVAGTTSFSSLLQKKSFINSSKAGYLVIGSLIANVLNLSFSAYLGRTLSFEDFGTVAILTTLTYLVSIFINAGSTTLNHEVAYRSSHDGTQKAADFFSVSRMNAVILVGVISSVWLLCVTIIAHFFHVPDMLIVLFTPFIIFGIIDGLNRGFLQGIFNFSSLFVVIITEVISKLFFAFFFIQLNLSSWVSVSLPLSIMAAFIVSSLYSRKVETAVGIQESVTDSTTPLPASASTMNFPLRFYWASVISGLSTAIFLSIDLVLVKHYFSPSQAGIYGLLSLIGKMVFFFGSLLNGFIITYVSRDIGEHKNPEKSFYTILYGTVALVVCADTGLFFAGQTILPFIFGTKIVSIFPYMTMFAAALSFLTLASSITLYRLALKQYVFSIVSLTMSIIMCLGIILFHGSLHSVVSVIYWTTFVYFLTAVILHVFYQTAISLTQNVRDLLLLFVALPQALKTSLGGKNILIFNWRDIHHAFSGGAELYIHEIAKRWVQQGHSVTLFCGNDRQHAHNEYVDGIRIIRRGGFFVLYVYALLYYFFRFRGKFDVIVDCHNGIPFFLPLIAKEPVVCLVHHVHQEVFTNYLSFPFGFIARILERDIMPRVYTNTTFITVSESSRDDMHTQLQIPKEKISIINPGVATSYFSPGEKSATPLIVYLGRLQFYKSINVLIDSFQEIIKKIPEARLVIVGDGEARASLEALVTHNNLQNEVKFIGKVSEEDKRSWLQRSWVAVNPSMREGWGITTIETNACGTPVIASNVAGLRDSVKDTVTGFLVPYGDSAAIAAKVIDICLNSGLRIKLEQQAIAWAKQFSWDIASNSFLTALTITKIITNKNNINKTNVMNNTTLNIKDNNLNSQSNNVFGKPLSVMVGIPTCYGGSSLIPTVKSIKQTAGSLVSRIVVVADRTPIAEPILVELKKMGVEVIWNKEEGTQPRKIKQMLDLCTEDIFVTTQDDVIFTAQTIPEIVKAFNHGTHITMVSSLIAPLAPVTFFESIMGAAVRIPGRIAISWNKGENHLSASGRCLSFRTEFMRQYRIPENMVNGDMFLYLENKRLGGGMIHADKSVAYIRCPQHLKDQIGPSSRYQISKQELATYYDYDISYEYSIPRFELLKAFIAEALIHPIQTIGYVFVYGYTRIKPQSTKIAFNPLWNVDISTKNTV